jgi:iron complex transport system ATP-binding protein
MTDPKNALVVNNLSFHHILSNVSFTSALGKITVIIGPNGAGKSSLLKCISGLSQADKGEVLFQKSNLPNLHIKERAKLLAILTQKVDVAFDFYVEDIIELGFYPHCFSKKVKSEKLYNLLVEFNLVGSRKRFYNTLSGGEQQRVQMARVFAQLDLDGEQKNKLLLLDEHVSHLDPYYQHLSFSQVKEAARKYNLSVIAVVHDLSLAAEYADNVLLLNNGVVDAFGTAEEVISAQNMSRCFNMKMTGSLNSGFKLSI